MNIVRIIVGVWLFVAGVAVLFAMDKDNYSFWGSICSFAALGTGFGLIFGES